MKTLATMALVVAACGGGTTGPVQSTSPSAITSRAPSVALPTPSPEPTAISIDSALGKRFEEAVVRFEEARPSTSGVDQNDWVAVQSVFIKQADAYQAFAIDLEAIPFPETVDLDGQVHELGATRQP